MIIEFESIRDDLEHYSCLWTIYGQPSDYPEGFVARLHVIGAGNRPSGPTNKAFFGPTPESVREQLPEGLVNLGRMKGDEAHIVESWI